MENVCIQMFEEYINRKSIKKCMKKVWIQIMKNVQIKNKCITNVCKMYVSKCMDKNVCIKCMKIYR